ncbi:alpha/beta hydrolase family protein [Enterocloster lavalensis]|mgnify:FL=1|uniref:alpha/beta hydrolase family protein n=1 Tax=Enterocloster lavalensis TaxID=460384 RepID=UPI000D1A3FA2|nr:alpha/beta hydrolase [Enterocloster lavalensis]PST34454.1 alpha/beta hydrolase [Enterocloster lavalensis]
MAGNGVLDANLTDEMKQNLFGNAYLNMLWHCKSDPRFHYWVHLPDYYYEDKDKPYRLMVVIHGTGCRLEGYMKAAAEFADANHMAVLAPVFPGGLIIDDDFNSYKLLNCDGVRYDLALLSMVDEMAKRYPGVETEKFFLFGHSGGGQFTNRFLFAHPERLAAAAIGAPGRPTFLNFEEDYFWGVRDFKKQFDKELDQEAVKQVPVLMVVGALDTKFIGDSPYGTCRVERLESLKKNFEDHGIYVEMEILPGIEHVDGDVDRIRACSAFFKKYL